MKKVTTKTKLLLLFFSLGSVAYAQVQNENTYTFPHFNDVGVGTTVTTNSSGLINYKLTTASKLFRHQFFNPESGMDLDVAPTIPFRILAETPDNPDLDFTRFLFEARVYTFGQPFNSNQRVYSMQQNGELLLGENSNSTTNYDFPYSIVSDHSIYSQDKIFAENRIGIGTTNPAASLDVRNGDIALNNNKLRLRSASDGNNYLQYKPTFISNAVDGPVLSGLKGGVLASSSGGAKNVLRWTDDGRVGINTNTPSFEFEVNGWVKFDSDANINDEIQFESQAGFHRIAFNSLRFHEWGKGDILTLNNGYLGINRTTPTFALDVVGDVGFDGPYIDDELVSKAFPGYRSLDFHKLVFREWSYGDVLTISEGKVGIWNTTPTKALDVTGTIQSSSLPASDAIIVENRNTSTIEFKVTGNGYVYAREVEITMNPFPDYVFNEKYNLMSLDDLKTYISTNKHLPGVKTAEEVKEEGIGIGELSKIQMEKIEELTLYILQLENRLKKLEAKIKK